MQPAGADPAGAVFVLLHLLDRQPQRIGQLILVQTQKRPAHANAVADVNVDGVGLESHFGPVICGATPEAYHGTAWRQSSAMSAFHWVTTASPPGADVPGAVANFRR